MRLTGKQHKELRQALLTAFPTRAELAQMVRHQLDQSLEHITGGGDLSDIVFSLIKWAEARGRTEELIVGARYENPGNPDLSTFAEQFQRATAVEPSPSVSTEASEQQLKRRWPIKMSKVLRDPVFIVGVLALMVALGTWLWPNIWPDIRHLLFPSVAPTPTSGPGPYYVRVQAEETGECVQGARVTIDVAGQAPLDDITDVNGLARIFVPSSHANQPGVLRVEATGYERYVQQIDLTPGVLPDVVQLESAP